ncbi:MAG: MATE family efflux transporter [Candidatus Eisenbacteria bacterium]|nr:MATE family efflux transporter [Candidatus Eisenbacteria bacterium]
MGAKDSHAHLEGSIIGSILKMGVPSMIGFAFGNLYDLADAYWLSRLGSTPVAAVTILGPFLWVVHSANMIVGAGSVAVISRRWGERDRLRTELAIRETLLLKWIVALGVGLAGYLFVPWIIRVLGAEGEAIDLGVTYGRIIFLGIGFNFATYSIFTALRGVANPKMAMVIMLGFTVLNIVLDPFLIFGWWVFPPMGVAGAAWASVISYATAFAVGLLVLTSGVANIRLHLRSAHPVQWRIMGQILRIGAPTAIGEISFSSARTVIMPMISMFGMGVVAAYGVSTRISSFGIMLLVGIGLGLSALIGHNVGAGKLERARRTAHQAVLLATGIMTAIGVLTFVGAGFIMRRFFADPQIVAHGIEMMRIFSLGFPFIGLYITLENVFGGVGENRPAMIANIIHSWVLEVPAVYACTKLLGWSQTAVWWSIVAAGTIIATIFYSYYRRGSWLHVKV